MSQSTIPWVSSPASRLIQFEPKSHRGRKLRKVNLPSELISPGLQTRPRRVNLVSQFSLLQLDAIIELKENSTIALLKKIEDEW